MKVIEPDYHSGEMKMLPYTVKDHRDIKEMRNTEKSVKTLHITLQLLKETPFSKTAVSVLTGVLNKDSLSTPKLIHCAMWAVDSLMVGSLWMVLDGRLLNCWRKPPSSSF